MSNRETAAAQAGQQFSLGAVLTVVTGKLLADMGEVHALLDHMTGDVLMTHQLPRAVDECQPAIREQHPDLAALSVPEFEGERHVKLWLQVQEASLGVYRDVQPLAAGVHVWRDPIAELVEMMGDGESPRSDVTRGGV